MLAYGIPPRVPRRRPFIYLKPPNISGSIPSLSGHAFGYRWHSLPRVRRHRASKAQGSSERVFPCQVTIGQLIYTSLSRTHHWYEMGTLKVPATIGGWMPCRNTYAGEGYRVYCVEKCDLLVQLFGRNSLLLAICGV